MQDTDVLNPLSVRPISVDAVGSMLNTHHVVFHCNDTTIDIDMIVVVEHGGRHIDER